MATPIRNKLFLWRSSRRGLKSRFSDDVKSPAISRDDIPDVQVSSKIKRGGNLQELRLRYYPSIDVNKDEMFAGRMEGDLEDARDRLFDLGFRNNPTAYVEITDEHGPDDGSYSKQVITEDGTTHDIPRITQQPSFWKRLKEQFHITVYQLDGEVLFLAHKEVSAWLQPARHLIKNDASKRIGVRDFRDQWYDEFGEELGGKGDVLWETTH